jgi:hypothetical protein
MNEVLLSILTNAIAKEVFPEAKVSMSISAPQTVTAQAAAHAVYRDLNELNLLDDGQIEERMREREKPTQDDDG